MGMRPRDLMDPASMNPEELPPFFQVNASRLRRPLDAVDSEEPPDSCERYGFLKRAKQMPGSFFTDNFCMSALQPQ